MTEKLLRAYWQEFLAVLPPDSPYREKAYIAESWGDHPALADELGELIVRGIKTATCSALWEYEATGKALPYQGLITIALGGGGEPLCIVETTEVTVRKYNEVDSDFARAEGEGDFSLEYWRKAHRTYFSRVLPKIGKEFTEDMPLVCERFQVIYK